MSIIMCILFTPSVLHAYHQIIAVAKNGNFATKKIMVKLYFKFCNCSSGIYTDKKAESYKIILL